MPDNVIYKFLSPGFYLRQFALQLGMLTRHFLGFVEIGQSTISVHSQRVFLHMILPLLRFFRWFLYFWEAC